MDLKLGLETRIIPPFLKKICPRIFSYTKRKRIRINNNKMK
ncbi:hypothetical protein F383_31486 [Gossypium arboreum]|uniref:Uncharacterized protein n=1 Tax=Gossypium arboreum TaxID=29729 RepID=A0A0B0PKK1_GOSAR|nr:hypothetical protein F383_31486 [Gossypium arboreum]